MKFQFLGSLLHRFACRGYILLLAMLPLAGFAQQDVVIEAFDSAGQVSFSEVSNAVSYRVEWAPVVDGPWSNFAGDLLPTGSGSVTITVPMVYRVIATVTNPPPTDYFVLNSGSSAYLIDGQSNPPLELTRGQTYIINVNSIGHPFWIKTAPTTGVGNIYTNGVSNNGVQDGDIIFTVPMDAPDTLYYICQFHSAMQGVISITGAQSEDYLIVDLAAGPSASSYPVSYLPAVPGGGWTDEHKTTKLVFRRIPAGTYTMGSPVGELGRGSDEVQHQVTVSQPFYIGVFEVTQKQWERVMGNYPSYFTNVTHRDSRPVETVSYNTIRGTANWPTSTLVDTNSFMGRLRARTSKAFDLPTESQWEYAGRAGTVTALNSGQNLTNTSSDASMNAVGRYWFNGGSGFSQDGDASVGTAKAGSYVPNAWGLYDIHGNVWEWCLDWDGTYPGTVTDPLGPNSGSARVLRGGSWFDFADFCRSAQRGRTPPVSANDFFGFRVALPPGQ